MIKSCRDSGERADHASLLEETGKIRDGFFNIGSGRSISITDLAHMMIEISGRQLEPEYQDPRPGDAKMSVADISKASKLLDWRPSTVLKDGLQNLLATEFRAE